MAKTKNTKDTKDTTTKDTIKKLEREIPQMSRDLLKRKKAAGTVVPDITVNGFPGDFHVMMISTVIAADALSSYDIKDGDVYDYITWYLSSAIDMLIDELNKHNVKKDYILAAPYNFYKKIYNMFEKTGDIHAVAASLHIVDTPQYIQKAITICEERII